MLARRLARRSFLKKSLAAAPALVVGTSILQGSSEAAASNRLEFKPVSLSIGDNITVPPGYNWQVLLRWGDPLFLDSPPFDPLNQTAEGQRVECGYNCDFKSFFSLPLG